MPLKPADEIVAQPVSWLWPLWLGLGKLAILDGDPDLGKSLIALELCARLSTGRPFPDGRPGPGAANALVLSAEDSPNDTIIPRLRRLGADLKRVFVWQRDRDDEDWPWRFPAHVARLEDALTRTDARLAVIDPIMSFLDDSVLSGSDQSVRRALNPLIQLADKHRCAVLLHRHLNKQGGHHALYRGIGSIAFVAACRCALLVGCDPHEQGRCVLAQVRNSNAERQPSLAYRITGSEGGQPTLGWLGTSPLLANELLGDSKHTERNPRDRAADFLEQFLAAGPRTASDLWEAAQKAGLSARTLQRAKAGLGIHCQRTYVEDRPVSYWLLPGQKSPAGPALDPELARIIAEMEKQYPPRNPLDADDFEDDED